MSEREKVLKRLRYLHARSAEKQLALQKEHGTSDEVGFFTKEALLIARLQPAAVRLGITPEEIAESVVAGPGESEEGL